ncbi:MAG: hypothetical protein IKX18_03025 [Muribaculaceae bacterium]|nr:hypothetical protein [Muribaculaceae bacterium]
MKRIMCMIIIGACCMSVQAQAVEHFVTTLLEQYPEARLLDIYKSCFQDCMGAEHLVGDTASVRAYLEQELATTDVDDLMPWYYEPCGTGGNHVRVSLRAIKEGHITTDALLDAFIASANVTERPSVDQWTAVWRDIVSVIDGMGLQLPFYEQDKQLIEDVLAQGRYAISHSPEYREAYAPHYRIVRRDVFERQILPLLPCQCRESAGKSM